MKKRRVRNNGVWGDVNQDWNLLGCTCRRFHLKLAITTRGLRSSSVDSYHSILLETIIMCIAHILIWLSTVSLSQTLHILCLSYPKCHWPGIILLVAFVENLIQVITDQLTSLRVPDSIFQLVISGFDTQLYREQETPLNTLLQWKIWRELFDIPWHDKKYPTACKPRTNSRNARDSGKHSQKIPNCGLIKDCRLVQWAPTNFEMTWAVLFS